MGQVCPNSASTSQHYAPTQCQGVSAYGSAQTGSEKSKLQTSHSSVESKVISRGASCTQEDIRRSLRRDKEAVFTQPKARDTRDSNTDQLLPPGVNVHATKTNHHQHNHQQQQQQQNYHNHHHQKQKQPQQKQKQHERERREDISHHVRQNSVKEAKPEGKSDHKHHHHHHHHHHHQHRHHTQHQGQRQHEQTPPTTKHQDFQDWNQQQNQQQKEGSLQSHKIHGGHRKGPAMQAEQYGFQSQAFQQITIQQTTIRDSKRGLQLGRGVVPQVEEQHKDSRHRHGQKELQMDSPVGYHTQNAHNAELSARRTQVPNSHKMHKRRPEGIEADALRRSIKEERRLREGRQKHGKEDRKRSHKARLVGDPVYSLPPLVK